MIHCLGYIHQELILSIVLRDYASIQIFAQEKRFIESGIPWKSQVFLCNIGCWFNANNFPTSILCSFELGFLLKLNCRH